MNRIDICKNWWSKPVQSFSLMLSQTNKKQQRLENSWHSQPSTTIWTGLEYLSLPQSIHSTDILKPQSLVRGSGLFHDEFHSHVQIGSIKSAESRTPLIIMRTEHNHDREAVCFLCWICGNGHHKIPKKSKAKCPHLSGNWWQQTVPHPSVTFIWDIWEWSP